MPGVNGDVGYWNGDIQGVEGGKGERGAENPCSKEETRAQLMCL